MSKIMDRIIDLGAVAWPALEPATMEAWEREALEHDPACRCQKCAVFFARMSPEVVLRSRACAIHPEVIAALRDILKDCGKR